MEFAGAGVVVTGAAGGIGEALARRFHALGSTVVVADVLEKGVRSVADDLESALHEVVEALGRIDAGTYGRCVDCGGEIPPKRLAALPASARCVECQRKQER